VQQRIGRIAERVSNVTTQCCVELRAPAFFVFVLRRVHFLEQPRVAAN
jgi:hypothetical protein